jgi:hypothetical protein
MAKPARGLPRLAAALPIVAVAVVVAGCGPATSSSDSSILANTPLTIYISEPANPSTAQLAVITGEQLAFSKLQSEVIGYRVKLDVAHGKTLSANARTAIQNQSTIAYLGEIASGSSLETAGITESLDILELSPTDTVTVPHNDYEEFSTYGRNAYSTAGLKPSGYPVHGEEAYGYQAMAILLEGLKKVGPRADNRADVIKAVAKLI